MTVTATASRSMRIGNETALSGSETIVAELGEHVNQEIAIAADDAVVAIGAVTKANLDALLLIADQDLTVKVIGGNPFPLHPGVGEGIVTLGDLAANVGGTFTVAGDLTEWLWPGDQIWITGCTTVNNNGRYIVIGTAVAAGITTVEVVQFGRHGLAGQLGTINAPAIEVFDTVEVGAGAANLVYKIQSRGIKNNIGVGDDFTVAGPPGQIEIAGDFSFLQADDKILIEEATTGNNNGIFTVVTAVYAAPDTTITVEEAVAVELGTALTTFQWVRTELLVRLTADVSHLWTREGSILSPVLEDITQLLVTNASGVAADLQARIVKSSP